MKNFSLKQAVLVLILITSFGGVLLNMYLAQTSAAGGSNPATTFVNTLSYFTIQSNLLVALICLGALLKKNFFGKFENLFLLGALLDITITFVVVQLILSKLYSYEGLFLLGDQLVHVATPILFVGYWLFIREKKKMSYRNVFLWLAYPILYLVYSLVRGPMVDWYPYPFINASVLSLGQILMNSVALFVVFVVLGSIFTAVNNYFAKK